MLKLKHLRDMINAITDENGKLMGDLSGETPVIIQEDSTLGTVELSVELKTGKIVIPDSLTVSYIKSQCLLVKVKKVERGNCLTVR